MNTFLEVSQFLLNSPLMQGRSKIGRKWPMFLVDEKECWNWLVIDKTNGYGILTLNHESYRAHVWIYSNCVGPITKGMVLDHLCRNKSCVNPNHLEMVTSKENTLRGTSFSAVNATKTNCPKGHLLSGTNLLKSGKRRHCRECMRKRNREYKANRKTSFRAAFAAADKAEKDAKEDC